MPKEAVVLRGEALQRFFQRRGWTWKARGGSFLYLLFPWGTLEFQLRLGQVLCLRPGEEHPPIRLPSTSAEVEELVLTLANRFANRKKEG